MKCEMANFSAEIKHTFSALELESIKSPVEPAPLVDCASQTEPSPKISRVLPQQTEPPPKSRVLPKPISRESSSDKGFKEEEAKYKKDIYDLKELEVKMKKTDEFQNDTRNGTISENLSNEKEVARHYQRMFYQII